MRMPWAPPGCVRAVCVSVCAVLGVVLTSGISKGVWPTPSSPHALRPEALGERAQRRREEKQNGVFTGASALKNTSNRASFTPCPAALGG
eukprot:5692827-Prymnesium_polylepis.1